MSEDELPLAEEERARLWRAVHGLTSERPVLETPGVIGVWGYNWNGSNAQCLFLRRGPLLLEMFFVKEWRDDDVHLRVINPPDADVYACNLGVYGDAKVKGGEFIYPMGRPGPWYRRLRQLFPQLEAEAAEHLRLVRLKREGWRRDCEDERAKALERAESAVVKASL